MGSHIQSLVLLAAQTGATNPKDIAVAVGMGLFALGFVVLAFLALRKKKKERLELLTEASEEAAETHDLEQKALGTSEGSDAERVPAASLKDAERALKQAESEASRAARDRARLEADADETARDQVEEAKRREADTKRKADEAKAQTLRLRSALSRTRDGLFGRIGKAFGGKGIDADTLEELEAILFTADIGARTAEKLLEAVRDQVKKQEVTGLEGLQSVLKQEILRILSGVDASPLALSGETPRVLMVVGVNGAGKTTTIGKLTHHLQDDGHTVMLGAGDTFRAAAVEQLEVWAQRNGVDIVKGKEKADPASVLYDAVEQGKAAGKSVVICDTAGRLHTKVNLMEELSKVYRVLGKAQQGAPHEVLLVLDATVGQNAIQQAKQFGEAVPLTGIVLTKLDGTAKGGVIIGIADELGIPVRYIGVGEKIEDLRPFDAGEFVDALVGGGTTDMAA